MLFDATTGGKLAELTAFDAEAYDRFGQSARMSGNTIVVGSPFDDSLGSNSGSAYVFRVAPEPASWSMSIAILTMSIGATTRRRS
jgi:hypothetical protein